MKAVISSTYDNNYLFFLPIVTFCWNKLGVEVICFLPERGYRGRLLDKAVELESSKKKLRITDPKFSLVLETCSDKKISFSFFKSPVHKEATYAQCSRLYAACLDLQEDEILVTSDVDMILFERPPYKDGFTVFGYDLVPIEQYPMCYVSASVKEWRYYFCKGRTYQKCLDDLLSHIETDHFRGNYWGKDQEELYKGINLPIGVYGIPRARPGTQFASKRYDRDDAYLLDRLSPDTIDFHMPRPGYETNNFEIIMKVLEYHYPHDNFDWLKQYRQEYINLL